MTLIGHFWVWKREGVRKSREINNFTIDKFFFPHTRNKMAQTTSMPAITISIGLQLMFIILIGGQQQNELFSVSVFLIVIVVYLSLSIAATATAAKRIRFSFTSHLIVNIQKNLAQCDRARVSANKETKNVHNWNSYGLYVTPVCLRRVCQRVVCWFALICVNFCSNCHWFLDEDSADLWSVCVCIFFSLIA